MRAEVTWEEGEGLVGPWDRLAGAGPRATRVLGDGLAGAGACIWV